MMNCKHLVEKIRDIYQTNDFIPLHAPQFFAQDKVYVNDAIDSTFVSSIGKYVVEFEAQIAHYTKSTRAVAVVNGTSALHTALKLVEVAEGDIVITQALTFIATCNAISYLGAEPVFVDVDRNSMGLCSVALEEYLESNAKLNSARECIHKITGQRIKAVVPMHTFGHPVDLDPLMAVCSRWQLNMVEDAAESLGSWYKGLHTGTFGDFGAISFNGNKIITTGTGGILLCKTEKHGSLAKHITTTAKIAHPYETSHDQIGFNYRMSNLNAALGCAQLEKLDIFLKAKRYLAIHYENFFSESAYQFFKEPDYGQSNYWLNAICCESRQHRDELLNYTNNNKISTRPIWTLMHRLPMFESELHGELKVTEWLADRIINLPSSPILDNI